jgi:hypothetical protein
MEIHEFMNIDFRFKDIQFELLSLEKYYRYYITISNDSRQEIQPCKYCYLRS